jgi:HPt (histidine-containing phosphotransfer) domain-containing protein
MAEHDVDGECPIDLEAAREYACDDEALLHELFAVFLEEARGQVTAMRDAFRAGRAGDVMDLAHTVKGSLRLLGAPATALLAEQLELGGRTSQLEGLGPVVEKFDREMARLLQWVETRLATRAAGTTIAPESA